MNIWYAPVLLCAVYSLINGFIPDKESKMTDKQLVMSGIICLFGDAGGVFLLSKTVFGL